MRIIAILAFMSLASTAPAAPTLAQRLVTDAQVPGAGVALWDGETLSVSVAGQRVQGGAPVEDSDLWHIGSNTKAMTATLIARLVEAGVLDWDDTLGEALGEAVPNMRPRYRDVTLVDLLRHRSGLPANDRIWHMFRYAMAYDASEPELSGAPLLDAKLTYAKRLLRRRPATKNRDFLYSNAGYVMAGLMAELATGQPYEQLMQDQVWRPLGITSAGFGPPARDGSQPQGHQGNDCAPADLDAPADNPEVLNAAGRAHMTLSDQMRFLRAHMEQPSDFLSPESWALLHDPEEDYALGWGVDARGVLGHSGSNTMWISVERFETGAPFALIANANCARIDAVTQFVDQIWGQRADKG